jgi:hypothetical protein
MEQQMTLTGEAFNYVLMYTYTQQQTGTVTMYSTVYYTLQTYRYIGTKSNVQVHVNVMHIITLLRYIAYHT